MTKKIIIGVATGCAVAAIALGVGLGVGLNPAGSETASQRFVDSYYAATPPISSTARADLIRSSSLFCYPSGGIQGGATSFTIEQAAALATPALKAILPDFNLGARQEGASHILADLEVNYFCWTAS